MLENIAYQTLARTIIMGGHNMNTHSLIQEIKYPVYWILITCDIIIAELYHWIYDAGLDQIIMEILSKSHQTSQMIPNIYCQPYKIPIILLLVMLSQARHSAHLTLMIFTALPFLGW